MILKRKHITEQRWETTVEQCQPLHRNFTLMINIATTPATHVAGVSPHGLVMLAIGSVSQVATGSEIRQVGQIA